MAKAIGDRRKRLLEAALERWQTVQGRDRLNFPEAEADPVEAFARWLIQYSGLVEPALPGRD